MTSPQFNCKYMDMYMYTIEVIIWCVIISSGPKMHCDYHTIPIVTSKNINIISENFFPKCTLYKRDCIFTFFKLRKYLSTKALFIDRNNPSEEDTQN